MVAFGLALAASGCGGGGESAGSDDRMQVVAGFYPSRSPPRRSPATASRSQISHRPAPSPTTSSFSPRDVERIRFADLVLYAGGGFQPALEEAADGAEGGAWVEVLDGLDLREEDGEADPHVWLDPVRFAQVMERIGAELGVEASARQPPLSCMRSTGSIAKGSPIATGTSS